MYYFLKILYNFYLRTTQKLLKSLGLYSCFLSFFYSISLLVSLGNMPFGTLLDEAATASVCELLLVVVISIRSREDDVFAVSLNDIQLSVEGAVRGRISEPRKCLRDKRQNLLGFDGRGKR